MLTNIDSGWCGINSILLSVETRINRQHPLKTWTCNSVNTNFGRHVPPRDRAALQCHLVTWDPPHGDAIASNFYFSGTSGQARCPRSSRRAQPFTFFLIGNPFLLHLDLLRPGTVTRLCWHLLDRPDVQVI